MLFGVGTLLIPVAEVASKLVPPDRLALFESTVTIQSAFITLFFAYLVMNLADSVQIPASNTLFVNEGDKVNSVAASVSLRLFPSQVSAIVGPVVIGSVVDYFSYPTAFGFAAGIAVTSGTLVAVHQPYRSSISRILKLSRRRSR